MQNINSARSELVSYKVFVKKLSPIFGISPNFFVRVQPRLTIRCSCFDMNSFTSWSFLQPICLYHIIGLRGPIILMRSYAPSTHGATFSFRQPSFRPTVVVSDLGSIFLCTCVVSEFPQPCVCAAVHTTRNLIVRCISTCDGQRAIV